MKLRYGPNQSEAEISPWRSCMGLISPTQDVSYEVMNHCYSLSFATTIEIGHSRFQTTTDKSTTKSHKGYHVPVHPSERQRNPVKACSHSIHFLVARADLPFSNRGPISSRSLDLLSFVLAVRDPGFLTLDGVFEGELSKTQATLPCQASGEVSPELQPAS